MNTTDLTPVLNALTAYAQDQKTLQPVVDAATKIWGDEWTDNLPDAINTAPDVAPEQKNELADKANHAVHYYGALAAWEEAHQYLTNKEPVDASLINERIPTLEYWLNLFGDEGKKVIEQLKQLQQKSAASTPSEPPAQETPTPTTEEPEETLVPEVESEEAPAPTPIAEETVVAEEDILEASPEPAPTEEAPVPDTAPVAEPEETLVPETEPTEPPPPTPTETPEPAAEPESASTPTDPEPVPVERQPKKAKNKQAKVHNFDIANFTREKKLYNDLMTWVGAQCVRRGITEPTAFPHYGFVLELMQTLKSDTQTLLTDKLLEEIVDQQLQGGRPELKNLVNILDAQLAAAPKVAEKEVTAEDAKALLGGLDTSNKKEYLGPAPDGFELLDDPYQDNNTNTAPTSSTPPPETPQEQEEQHPVDDVEQKPDIIIEEEQPLEEKK